MDNNNTMEYRIGLEKQNKRNDQVTELILDNCRASQISGLTEEFVNLETLSLINVGLTTLKGFPKLPKLKKLEISDNRLTGGLNLLHGSPNLQSLNISGNRIKDLDALEPLKEFHDLVSLDLYNCDVTKVEEYRKKVFDLLPNLKALDGYDRDEREVDSEDDDEEGSDVENHIVMGDNELDEEEAVDDDEDDDEDVDDDDDDDEDDDDDDDDEEDDEDDDDDDEEVDDEHDDEEDEGGVDYENEVDIHDDIENEDNEESLEQESLEERFGEVQGDHYHPPKKVRLDPCPELGDEDVNNFDEDKLENDDEEKLGSEVEDKPENEEEDKDNALGDAPSI